MHITHRGALASALAVQPLRQDMEPGSTLTLKTDASSTAWAWRKGSKKKAMNGLIARTLHQLHKDSMNLEAQHIPGITKKRADWLSRNPDPKNYMLRKEIFRFVCRRMKFRPVLDMFASKDNKQLAVYCSWRTDRKSHGNAFSLKLSKQPCWLNSSVGFDYTGVAKNSTGPCNVLSLSSYLEKRSVVENNVGVVEGKQVRSARRNAFPKPKRKKHAATTLGNSLHGASGLMGTALKAMIRELDGEHHIPAKYRVQWLQDQLHASANPRDKLACQTAIK